MKARPTRPGQRGQAMAEHQCGIGQPQRIGRNSSGIITSTSAIVTQVLTQIQNVMPTTGLTVTVTQPTISSIPMVSVNVSGSVPYLIQLWGTTYPINRTVVFRDEGR